MVEKILKKKVTQWIKSLKLENEKKGKKKLKERKEITKGLKPCKICIMNQELLSS
jgi:hypothetical protein